MKTNNISECRSAGVSAHRHTVTPLLRLIFAVILSLAAVPALATSVTNIATISQLTNMTSITDTDVFVVTINAGATNEHAYKATWGFLRTQVVAQAIAVQGGAGNNNTLTNLDIRSGITFAGHTIATGNGTTLQLGGADTFWAAQSFAFNLNADALVLDSTGLYDQTDLALPLGKPFNRWASLDVNTANIWSTLAAKSSILLTGFITNTLGPGIYFGTTNTPTFGAANGSLYLSSSGQGLYYFRTNAAWVIK